jgi:peptidoglycan/xylan/chitin deacetylase (PgdA/CDA1 family)
MYHDVSDEETRGMRSRRTNPAYTVTAERFAEQMRSISRMGCRTATLDEVANGEERERCVLLTFDDGIDGACRKAVPIMKKYDLPATFFVVTGFVGRRGYADWTLLREMEGDGMSIQSHGVSHEPLSEMSDARMRSELERSKKTIEDKIGSAVDFLSAPHGMFDEKVRSLALSAGYRALCTSEPGYTHSHGSPAVIKRINVTDTCSVGRFEDILRGSDGAILFESVSKKLKNLAKKSLGYDRYRRLYTLRYRIEKS